MGSGAWCPYGMPGDLPTDQRIDDGQAVVFETEPLRRAAGASRARRSSTADVSADRPNAFLVARLSLVAPDGAATRISYGVLNLTHRDSHAEPSPLVPGERYRVRFKLNDVGQAVPAGHRLRLSLTNAYWPTIWPSPQTGDGDASHRRKPARRCRSVRRVMRGRELRAFEPPEGSAAAGDVVTRPPSRERRAELDLTGGRLTVVSFKDRGAERIVENGIESRQRRASRPTRSPRTTRSRRGRRCAGATGCRAATGASAPRSTTVQTATEDAFLITTSLDAYEGDTRIFSRSWTFEIARDLV